MATPWAEFIQPVERARMRDLLGYEGGDHFCDKVSALVARGLLRDKYRGIERFISLNIENPIVPPLRWWLYYLNRATEPRFHDLAKTYREEVRQKRNKLAGQRWRDRKRAGKRR